MGFPVPIFSHPELSTSGNCAPHGSDAAGDHTFYLGGRSVADRKFFVSARTIYLGRFFPTDSDVPWPHETPHVRGHLVDIGSNDLGNLSKES